MQNSQLDRLLRLIRRTGDKAVVVDRESEHIFMLMDLDDYEGMLDVVDGGVVPTNKGGAGSGRERNDEPDTGANELPVIEIETPDAAPEASKSDDEDSFDDYILDDLLDASDKKSDQPSEESIPEISVPDETESITKAEIQEPASAEPTVEPIIEPGKESAAVVEEIWNKDTQAPSSDEVSIKDIPSDEEEEKFYLEPVE